MPGHLAGGVREVHDLRRGRAVLAAEDAVAEPEVQGRADDHDQVGGAQRLAARLGDQQRVAAGDDAPAHPVGDHGDTGLLDEAQRGLLGPVGPHVGAEHQHRAGRGGEQCADLGQRVRVGLEPLPGAHRGTVDGRLVEELVHRHVEEGRPAVRGAGHPEGLVDGPRDLGDLVHGAAQLRHRREQRRVVELLQRAHAPAVGRRTAADHDERRPAERRLRDRADAVGDPWAGGEHGEAGDAGQLADRLRGEHRRLLVPHVEDPHRRVGLDRAVVHREDVGAGQREHRVHAVRRRDGDGVVATVALATRCGVGRGLGDVGHTAEVTGW